MFYLLEINYSPNRKYSIILLSVRFSEILAVDENKQVLVYLVAALLQITEDHLSSQYQDDYEPLIADELLD
jgi:hypothetical protein